MQRHAIPENAAALMRTGRRALAAAFGAGLAVASIAAPAFADAGPTSRSGEPAAAAQPSPRAAGLPPVEEIVAGNAKARGGVEAWRRVNTLTERGRIEHGQLKGPHSRHVAPGSSTHALDQSLPFTLQFKRPHKMRLEMDLGDTKALQLFDGTSGWMMQPSAKGPLTRQYSQGEAAAAAEQADPEGPLIDAAAKGTAVSLEGEETVEGHRAFKLKLTLKNGAQRNVWVDRQSMLDLKIDGTRVIEGKAWPTETYFYDWRQSGGVTLPGRIETAVGDVRTSSRIVVQQVLINAPLGDDLFSIHQPELASPAAADPKAGK